jgi:hypothetical protein
VLAEAEVLAVAVAEEVAEAINYKKIKPPKGWFCDKYIFLYYTIKKPTDYLASGYYRKDTISPKKRLMLTQL